jgi:hypothetical protein
VTQNELLLTASMAAVDFFCFYEPRPFSMLGHQLENRAVWGTAAGFMPSPPLNKGGFTDAKACI